MNAGQLKDRISIKYSQKTADGYGGFTVVQATDINCWGKAEWKKGEIKTEHGSRSKYKEVEVIIRKKTFDEITDKDFQFTVNSILDIYRANDVYEYIKDEYYKIVGTSI